MRDAVLIVGGGLLQVPAIESAKRMGLAAIVTDGNPSAPGMRLADEAVQVDIYDVPGHIKAAEHLSHRYQFKGIFTEGADVEVTVASTAAAMHLPGISPEAAITCKNKVSMRHCFDAAGLPNPAWKEVHSLEDGIFHARRIGYPLIVKAVDNCASRGTMKVQREEDLGVAIDNAIKNSTTHTALLESLFHGPEQSIEILFDSHGNSHFLNIVDRLFSEGPWALELGHANPSHLKEQDRQTLFELTVRAAQAVGVRFGAFKADTIWTKLGPRILEVTARLSGGFDCQYTTPLATGRNFIKAALDLAVGHSLDRKDIEPQWHRYAAAWTALPEPGRVTSISHVKEALQLKGVRHVFLRVAQHDIIPPYQNCAARPAFVIAEGKTYEEAIACAQYGAKELCIQTQPVGN